MKGLRNANGLVVGPDDELFTTDNQGHWVPTNKLVHIKAGPVLRVPYEQEFHDGTVVSPPAIWLPYGSFSNSPTRPYFHE